MTAHVPFFSLASILFLFCSAAALPAQVQTGQVQLDSGPVTLIPDQFFGGAVGDFNGDGKPDVATLSSDGGKLTVSLGIGNGFFRGSTTATGLVTDVAEVWAAADLNGDGNLDVIAALGSGTLGPIQVAVFLGHGDGSFGDPILLTIPASEDAPFYVAVTSLNADSYPDLVVLIYDSVQPPFGKRRWDISDRFSKLGSRLLWSRAGRF